MKLTTIGSLYLTFVCLMPEFLIANIQFLLFRWNFNINSCGCSYGYSDASSNEADELTI